MHFFLSTICSTVVCWKFKMSTLNVNTHSILWFGSVTLVLSQIVKTVYASPSRVNFQLDSKKASIPIFVFYIFIFKRMNTIFFRYFILLLTITLCLMCIGSGNDSRLSRYMFCNWWFWLYFWCCGNKSL